MNLTDDDFTLMGLPRRYGIDHQALDQRWHQMQLHTHPDRFAGQGAAAQRIAMQWSMRINEAYRRLQHPIQRAAYICKLHGIDIETQDNTQMPREFLMQQMAWREALEESSEPAVLQVLHRTVESAASNIHALVEKLLDMDSDFTKAAQQVRAWMFIDKFLQDLNQRNMALTATQTRFP